MKEPFTKENPSDIDFNDETDIELTSAEKKDIEQLCKLHSSVEKLTRRIALYELDFYTSLEMALKNNTLKLIKSADSTTSGVKIDKINKALGEAAKNMKIIEQQRDKKENSNFIDKASDFSLRQMKNK